MHTLIHSIIRWSLVNFANGKWARFGYLNAEIFLSSRSCRNLVILCSRGTTARSLAALTYRKSNNFLTLPPGVPDPNPEPDPHVFGPPGSGSTSQRYGSGSFYHQAKIVRKTLIPNVLWLLLDFLSLKKDVNVPSKSNMQKNLLKKLVFLLASWRLMTKILGSGSGSISQRHGSADPDPHQNVMDPEHCFRE
jgi:hypothetical protein